MLVEDEMKVKEKGRYKEVYFDDEDIKINV